MNKCVFLDRDGVINKDYVDYVYTVEKFQMLDGVKEAVKTFKDQGYKVVVITNQSGIAKGIYTHEDVAIVHEHMNSLLDGMIDDIYYSPYHQDFTNSLTRKPGSLMLEKAVAKFDVDISQSYLVGDRPRDCECAKAIGLTTIIVDYEKVPSSDYRQDNLLAACQEVICK